MIPRLLGARVSCALASEVLTQEACSRPSREVPVSTPVSLTATQHRVTPLQETACCFHTHIHFLSQFCMAGPDQLGPIITVQSVSYFLPTPMLKQRF